MTKIQEMVKHLEIQVREARDSMNDAKQYGVNSAGYNAYMGQWEMATTLLVEARRLAAEEAKEKPSAPASLVEEMLEIAEHGDPVLSGIIREKCSRYRPSKTEDIVGELKQIIKYVGKKSADPWDNGYATCAHEVEEIIRKYEEGK